MFSTRISSAARWRNSSIVLGGVRQTLSLNGLGLKANIIYWRANSMLSPLTCRIVFWYRSMNALSSSSLPCFKLIRSTMVTSCTRQAANWLLNRLLKPLKFSMDLLGRASNHSRASPSSDKENARHHMASHPVRNAIALVNDLMCASGSAVPSYILNWGERIGLICVRPLWFEQTAPVLMAFHSSPIPCSPPSHLPLLASFHPPPERYCGFPYPLLPMGRFSPALPRLLRPPN